jgi:hypothetical protein
VKSINQLPFAIESLLFLFNHPPATRKYPRCTVASGNAGFTCRFFCRLPLYASQTSREA